MFRRTTRILSLVLSIVLLLSIGGVYAVWTYTYPPEPEEIELPVKLSLFHYADIYIIKITPKDSGLTKTDHTKASAAVSAGDSFEVTFYNGSDVSYYYDRAETIAGEATYDVTGIAQKDEIPPKTEVTATVTFSTGGEAEIQFHFTVDKDSIGIVVAKTAVDRFREILNSPDEYAYLKAAMDDHSGASRVTYIGNVYGAADDDSKAIETLFGSEFLNMDLDGDGNTEPITIMIKRENLDGDILTGAPYSYTSGWFNPTTTTVNGAEMTLYITAKDLSNVANNANVDVYAAAFTKYPEQTDWVELVPLTQGTATTNNYNGWGDANSFNTDTWVSNGGQTLKQMAVE